ncbi:MAG: DUF1460 domain-containing protein [Ignavibacteriales bacterium]|nr:DUF1460 domain-containing protein [Ignavibacteriales bacterium]
MKRRSFLIQTAAVLPLVSFRLPLSSDWFLEDDEGICRGKFELAVSLALRDKPFGDIIVEMGKSFLGTDYLARALEVPGEERLVVNMRGLDCVSFYENALVLARCIKKGTMSFEEYKKELQLIRYRGGVIDGYPSRLHYTSDYFHDNVGKGIWKNVTRDLGGVVYEKTINFMSTHPESYRQLKENPELIQIIRKQEDEIMKRETHYIPKENVAAIQEKIQDGDILGITTDIEGLDTSHTGIALWQERFVKLIHAPLAGKKVEISQGTLAEYLARNKRQTGIMIVRPLDPSTA